MSIFKLFCKLSIIVLKVLLWILKLIIGNVSVIGIWNLVILISHKTKVDLKINIRKIFLRRLKKIILVRFLFERKYKWANENIILLIDPVFEI